MSIATPHYQMAQRGRLFKLEPQTVARELPRVRGVRPLAAGDVIRERLKPEEIFRVVRVTPCREHGADVTVEDDREHNKAHRTGPIGMIGHLFEHADGAAIEVRP